jgi:hypothetical protein
MIMGAWRSDFGGFAAHKQWEPRGPSTEGGIMEFAIFAFFFFFHRFVSSCTSVHTSDFDRLDSNFFFLPRMTLRILM